VKFRLWEVKVGGKANWRLGKEGMIIQKRGTRRSEKGLPSRVTKTRKKGVGSDLGKSNTVVFACKFGGQTITG